MSNLFCGVILVLLCISRCPLMSCRAEEDFLQSECLQVPASEFVGSVKSTIDTVRQVTSIVSKFASFFGDFRLSNAISDCLDLLDLSADELTWTLTASKNPKGKNNSTGNLSADLKNYLSGALINQDTCMEGFDGTNGIVKNLVSGSLNQVTSLVRDILLMVRPVPKNAPEANGGRGKPWQWSRERKLTSNKRDNNSFPSWLKQKDRKLLQASAPTKGVVADVVVALDGTGNFTHIKDAISAAPQLSTKRFVIYIKKGIYHEYVEISKKKWNIMMIGDGIDVTVISGNRSFIDGWTTYRSATFAVKGQGFIARDITFENTAGPEKHQAVAFRSDSDLSVLFRCAVRGYQDTLYAHSMRQFYRECTITGTVDFIFGDGTAIFQNCQILARKGLPQQKNTITAHGRKEIAEAKVPPSFLTSIGLSIYTTVRLFSILMARSVAQTLNLIRTTIVASPSATRNAHLLVATRRESTQADRNTGSDTPEAEAEALAVQRIEDAIHRIIVRRSAPDWLPFRPGASYWVPPRRSSYGVADLVHKLANTLSEEEIMSLATFRGWPSSNFYLDNEKSNVSKKEIQAEDEEV